MTLFDAIQLSRGTGIVGRTTTGEFYRFHMAKHPDQLDPETGKATQYFMNADKLNFLMANDFFPVQDWEAERERYASRSLTEKIATVVGKTGGINAMMVFLKGTAEAILRE